MEWNGSIVMVCMSFLQQTNKQAKKETFVKRKSTHPSLESNLSCDGKCCGGGIA